MKKTIALAFIALSVFAASHEKTFLGVITDSDCGASHAAKNGETEADCVRHCVQSGKSAYALKDGTKVYDLSNQVLPAEFAGQKVNVTGTLNSAKTSIHVSKIEAAR
jgi:hypothetical protein